MNQTIFALETVGRSFSLALHCPHLNARQTAWTFTRNFTSEEGLRHSQFLLPDIFALLKQAGCTLADVGTFAFAAGPGSFTGLRLAAATIYGLALPRQTPVAALDTLMAAAFTHAKIRTHQSLAASNVAQSPTDKPSNAAEPVTTYVYMPARPQEVFAAAYQFTHTASSPTVIIAPHIAPEAAWQNTVARRCEQDLVLDMAEHPLQAEHLLPLVLAYPALIEPLEEVAARELLYVRHKVALDIHEQAQMRQGTK